METIKKYKFLAFFFAIVMLFGASLSYANTIEYVKVDIDVKFNGRTLTNGETLTNVKAGDTFTVKASCMDQRSIDWSTNPNFMADKGFKFNKEGMAILAHLFDSTDKKDYIRNDDPTSLTLKVPDFEAGSTHFVCFNAIGAVDGLVENGVEIEAGSGTFAVRLVMQDKEVPAEEPKTETITVSLSKEASNAKVSASVENGKFSKFVYAWDNMDNSESTSNPLLIGYPTKVGKHVLKVYGVTESGLKSAEKTLEIEVAEPQKEEEPEALTGTIKAEGPNGVLSTNNSKPSEVEEKDEIKVTISPKENFSKTEYAWDNDALKLVPEDMKIVVPSFEEGTTHKLTIKGTLKDGNVVTKVYYITIPKLEGELDLEPWMIENEDIKGLKVTLRNTSEEKKSNNNFYMLNEDVIYKIDYKNAGKATSDEVKLVFNIPLQFKVVDSDKGIVDEKAKTITWNFKNGLAEDFADTKEVIIRYTAFSKKSYSEEMIYPQAVIYKGAKAQDYSSVINYIYEDEDTVFDVTHSPYMFGDKEKPTFRPDDSISRAEGALVLMRIFEVDYTRVTRITTKYDDLDETYEEAQKAITKATELGVINGYPDGSYRPNDKMTRAEFMKIIASYIETAADVKGLEIKDDEVWLYKNSKRNDHWAIAEVTLLSRLNMTDVATNKNLRLDDEITRAEVAQLCNYYLFRAPAVINSKTKYDFIDVDKNHKLVGDIVEATRAEHEFRITEDGKEKIK